MLLWLISLGGVAIGAVSSQTGLDTFIGLMLLGWLWIVVRDRSFTKSAKWNWIGIEWAFFAYLAIVCLGFAVNAAPDVPWKKDLTHFEWILHLYFFIFAFSQVQITRKGMIQYFFLGFIIPSAYALASYIHGADFITGRENSRITGMTNSPTYHAHTNAVVFVFFAGILILGWKKIAPKWRYLGTLGLVIMGLSILLTFTRGIWLSIFFSSVVMLFFLNKKYALRLVIVTVSIGVLSYFAWPQFNKRIHHTFSTVDNEERIDLFNVNVEIWKEHPWLGIGYGENRRRNREYWDRPEWNRPPGYIVSHAHNQILNVLSTTGILGLIPFLCFWIFFIRKNWLLLRKPSSKENSFYYSLVFACMWAQFEFTFACFTDVCFEYAKIRVLIILTWALLIALERKAIRTPDTMS